MHRNRSCPPRHQILLFLAAAWLLTGCASAGKNVGMPDPPASATPHGAAISNEAAPSANAGISNAASPSNDAGTSHDAMSYHNAGASDSAAPDNNAETSHDAASYRAGTPLRDAGGDGKKAATGVAPGAADAPGNVPAGRLALLDAYDPLEPFNRTLYGMNTVVDNNVVDPVIRVYRKLIPLFIRERFSNFFSNLDDILVFGNCLLQTKVAKGGKVLGRLAINSTVGIAGLWDPATEAGLIKYNEDLGQTLGYWGVPPGPYLVLPLVGPSNARDLTGSVVGALGTIHVVRVLEINPLTDMTLSAIEALELRASLPFSYGDFDSPFEYEMVRTLYLNMRDLLVRDGVYRESQEGE